LWDDLADIIGHNLAVASVGGLMLINFPATSQTAVPKLTLSGVLGFWLHCWFSFIQFCLSILPQLACRLHVCVAKVVLSFPNSDYVV
jgi:hypothetical protein